MDKTDGLNKARRRSKCRNTEDLCAGQWRITDRSGRRGRVNATRRASGQVRARLLPSRWKMTTTTSARSIGGVYKASHVPFTHRQQDTGDQAIGWPRRWRRSESRYGDDARLYRSATAICEVEYAGGRSRSLTRVGDGSSGLPPPEHGEAGSDDPGQRDRTFGNTTTERSRSRASPVRVRVSGSLGSAIIDTAPVVAFEAGKVRGRKPAGAVPSRRRIDWRCKAPSRRCRRCRSKPYRTRVIRENGDQTVP